MILPLCSIPFAIPSAELTNVNGVSIETADYSDSYFFEVEDNKVKNVQFVGGCSGTHRALPA